MTKNNLGKTDVIKLRVLQFAKSQKLIMGDFYEKISVHPSTFSGKGLESALSGTTISEILKWYPELSADWLLLGRGEMLRKNNGKNTASVTVPKSNADNGGISISSQTDTLSIIAAQQDTINTMAKTIDRLMCKCKG